MAAVISEKSFAPDARYCNFYAGGDVAWSSDGSLIYCLNTTEVTAVDVTTGQVVKTFGTNFAVEGESQRRPATDEVDAEEDVIYAFALAPDSNALLVTAHRSGLLRMWSTSTGKLVKLWKAQHKGPVVKLQFSANDTLVCSSGADSTLRIWDYAQSRCVNVLKDFPGPALLLHFYPHAGTTEIYAAGSDNTIYCWDYASKKLLRKLRGHLSQVTALSFETSAADCKLLASVSRDKVLIIWQLEGAGTQHKVIPIYEELEGVCFLLDKNKAAFLVVACSQGQLKLINVKSAKISNLIDAACEIKLLLQCQQSQQLALVSAEHNILIYEVESNSQLSCIKQLIGFNDEILDLCYLGAEDRFLAVATNSKNIKVYDTVAQMNCKILAGHKDTVMTLSTAGGGNFLLSAGKDHSIFLWELQPETFTLECVAKNNSSHTATIGCITFGYNLSTIFATVCQDGSMKVWNLIQKSNEHSFSVRYSALAHDKEVNSVTFSPNNKMLATASQDKTAKLWSTERHACLGTLRGHTRGVWCVRFSPVDQIVMTCSSDCSLRIWSLANMACLKRLDQECTILRAEFIDHGKFIVSAASDGLLKIWNIKTNSCVSTLDEHADRVWSLAVSTRTHKYFYSGGADSKLIKWTDITEQSRNTAIDQRQELLQQEQQLQLLLQQRQDMRKAFLLALTLGKPRVSYKIVCEYVRQRDTDAIKAIIMQLNSDQRAELLHHVKVWSTNSRHSKVSNLILRHILRDLLANPTQKHGFNASNLVEVITPYTQRHFKRVNELNKELCFLDFIVQSI